MSIVYATVIFVLAGLCEIGGGYLIWLWLRADQPMWLGFLGGIALILYGIVATLQTFPTFGRVYAAYGGVFIVMSLLWAYWIDKEPPDKFDIIGAIICVVGVLVMVLPSRG
ncbi:membrane protein [Staphylococcus microti]|uniref:Membrane protein n=1 Tax=Staphylococcus microti TaxID=569857 RepID=A0A380GWV9_9STAP|nr:membrane protein [Staphylococcus microti]